MYHIIVNKKSRSGRGEKLWPVIEGELERRRTEFRVYPTKYHGSARETAARLTAKGVWNPDDVLLAIGGDGTANEAVDGITSLSDVKFGYIPTGSGNDFARGAGIPSDPLQALEAVLKGEEKEINIGTALLGSQKRRFLVSTGIGFDAGICHEALASKIKNTLNRLHLGKLTYVTIALRQLFYLEPFTLDAALENGEHRSFENVLFAVLAVLAAGYFFSILPATSRRQECLKFAEWNYAHRGLWNAAEGVPENSLPAFARAADQRYAIELDIQITKDGRIVVFHDDTMKRMCGNEGKISDYTYEELQQFHLGDSTEKIPLLREVLQTVDGRVPLLIEIKMPGLSTAVCAGFQKEMEGYTGMFCMESFNSLALRWCRRHMPQTLRGQLSGRFSKDDKVHLILRIMARHLMLNFIGKPDFIAYDHRYADCPGFLIDRMLFRTPAFAWTVKDEHVYNRTRKKFDAAIFEHFHPKDGFQKPMNCFLKNNKAY